MGEIKTGRNLYCAIGSEGVFGTAVRPTAMLRVTDASIEETVNVLESQTRLGSRATAPGAVVGSAVAGTINAELDSDNFGWFLKGALGSETVTQVGTTPEHIHTFTMRNDGNLPSFSIEIGLGDFRSRRYAGVKVNSLAVRMEPAAYVTADVGINGRAQANLTHAFLPAAVDVVANTITIPGHGFSNGDTVRIVESAGTPPAPLATGVTYFVVAATANVFSLSLSLGGAALDLTTAGAGTNFIQPWSVLIPSSVRGFTFNDLLLSLDGVPFGEARSMGLTFENSLMLEDRRVGGGGAIASLIGGVFGLAGEIQAVVNRDSWPLVERYRTLTRAALRISCVSNVPLGGATHRFFLDVPSAEITAAPVGTEVDGMMIALTYRGVLVTGQPITAFLHNARATLY